MPNLDLITVLAAVGLGKSCLPPKYFCSTCIIIPSCRLIGEVSSVGKMPHPPKIPLKLRSKGILTQVSYSLKGSLVDRK